MPRIFSLPMLFVLALFLQFGSAWAQKWRYASEKDEMGGPTARTASTPSLNRHNLGFPYQGGTRATLWVRQRGDDLDLAVMIDRGQIRRCSGNSCTMRVRFDEGDAQDAEFSNSSDGSSDTVFFDEAKDLIEKLKVAKQLRVELPLFQEGERVFTFTVAGLKLPLPENPPKKKK